MTLKHILRLWCFLLLSLSLNLPVKANGDTISYRGIRIGADLIGPAQYFLNSGRFNTHFSVDIPLNKFWFPVAEAGFASMNFKSNKIDYSLKGTYFLLGLDHNMIGKKNKEKIERDMAFVGYRLGYGAYGYQTYAFLIENSYWGNYSGNIKAENHHAFWAEVTAGVKTEIFRNLFLGWNVRMKIKLAGKINEVNKPSFIPGFGNPDNKVNAGVSFSVFYLIPF